MLIQIICNLFRGLLCERSITQEKRYPQQRRTEERNDIFGGMFEGISQPNEIAEFWENREKFLAEHELAFVPNGFPLEDGDATFEIEANGKKVYTYLWIRKGQTIEEVWKKRKPLSDAEQIALANR